MKMLVFGLLAAAFSALFDGPAAVAPPDGTVVEGQARVVVMARGNELGGAPVVVQAVGAPAAGFVFASADGAATVAGEGEQDVIVTTVNVPEDGSGSNQRHVVRMRRLGPPDPEAANRGWLGVSIGRVPEAVTSQIQGAADGVMILNVVENSPADRAGLKAHDIILSVGGEQVLGDVAATTDIIREHKPGETIAVMVLREGQPQTASVTLGSRAEMGAAAWKFRLAPGEVEEHIRTQGRMLQKDAHGNWVMKDLGDLSQLPAQIQAFIPQSENRTVQITVNNGVRNIAISTTRDGTSIKVEQAGDGPITVTRTDENGAETTATYATREELEAQDAEAAELFAGTDRTVTVELDGDGAFGGNLNFDFDFDFNTEDLHEHLMQWQEQFQQGMGQMGESYRKAMEEIREAVERIKQEHGLDGSAFGFMFRQESEPGATGAAPPALRWFHHQVRQSFQVRPDGTIEARIRRGDTEVTELFTNEADLQQRDPQLYQKFIETRNAEH